MSTSVVATTRGSRPRRMTAASSPTPTSPSASGTAPTISATRAMNANSPTSASVGSAVTRQHYVREDGAMVNVPAEQFAELVVDAIDSLPPKFMKLMDNVTIHVDDDSPPGNLYGLYEGIPLTARNNN